MAKTFTRRADGRANPIFAEHINELQRSLETVTAQVFNVKEDTFGAVGDGVTDDRAAILAAIAAADANPGGGQVVLPGHFGFTGLIEVPDGVTLWGAGPGSQQAFAPSCLVALDASAMIRVTGSGGVFGNLLIDGNNIGANLMEVTGGSNHVFMNLRITRATTSLLRLVGTQNANFYQTFLAYSGGDGLILDTNATQGCYNNGFFGGEIANCDGASIHTKATGGGTVTLNDDNYFVRMILENFTGLPHDDGTTMVWNEAGRRNLFDMVQFTNGNPVVPFSLYKTSDVGGTNSAIFRDCLFFSGAVLYATGIEVGPSASVRLEGRNRFQSLLNALSVDTAALTIDIDDYELISTTNFFSSPNGATEQGKIIHITRSRKQWRVRNTTDTAMSLTMESEAGTGIRMDVRPDRIGFMDGTSFTPDTVLQRLGANVLSTAVGDQISAGGSLYSRAATTQTGNYTALATDYYIVMNNSGASATVTLPAIAGLFEGFEFLIKRISTQNVVIDPNGAEAFEDAATTKTITTQYGFLRVRKRGTVWDIVGSGGTIT